MRWHQVQILYPVWALTESVKRCICRHVAGPMIGWVIRCSRAMLTP